MYEYNDMISPNKRNRRDTREHTTHILTHTRLRSRHTNTPDTHEILHTTSRPTPVERKMPIKTPSVVTFLSALQ